MNRAPPGRRAEERSPPVRSRGHSGRNQRQAAPCWSPLRFDSGRMPCPCSGRPALDRPTACRPWEKNALRSRPAPAAADLPDARCRTIGNRRPWPVLRAGVIIHSHREHRILPGTVARDLLTGARGNLTVRRTIGPSICSFVSASSNPPSSTRSVPRKTTNCRSRADGAALALASAFVASLLLIDNFRSR